jgi:hypothetical protein
MTDAPSKLQRGEFEIGLMVVVLEPGRPLEKALSPFCHHYRPQQLHCSNHPEGPVLTDRLVLVLVMELMAL